MYFPGGEGQTAPIDPQDIAAVAACALTQPGHEGQMYELTGGDLLTAPLQAEIISQVLGKPSRYMDVPPAAAREEMLKRGMPPLVANAVTEVFTFVRAGEGVQISNTFEQVTGRKPRTFEAWCRDHITAFA